MKSEYRRLSQTLDSSVVGLAIKLADAMVCDLLRNEGGDPGGDEWLDIERIDGMEDDMRYAAQRGFIVRHPTKRTRFRFTDAGIAELR